MVPASGGPARHDDWVSNPPLTAPLLFAHRGGRAHAPENTLEAFALALRLGATGLESDVWCSADGVPVLHHDGRSGQRVRRRTISTLTIQDLFFYDYGSGVGRFFKVLLFFSFLRMKEWPRKRVTHGMS